MTRSVLLSSVSSVLVTALIACGTLLLAPGQAQVLLCIIPASLAYAFPLFFFVVFPPPGLATTFQAPLKIIRVLLGLDMAEKFDRKDQEPGNKPE